MRVTVAVLLVLAAGVAGGATSANAWWFEDKSALRSAAKALSHAADECLYDVRDRRFTFESSRSCNALGALVMTYIEAGGMKPGEPVDIELIGTRARLSAWMARATSLAGGEPVRIW
jgi:hypothetical protein